MTTNTPPPVRPQRQRRSRARTIVPIAIAVWVALEIWLLTVVAGATNWLVVFLCILAGFVLGAAAVKRAGRSAWQNLAASVNAQQQGVQPGPPQGGGRTGLAMLGGLLLIIPGFVSDAVALVLLIPQARAFIGRRVDRAILGRAVPMPPGGPRAASEGPADLVSAVDPASAAGPAPVVGPAPAAARTAGLVPPGTRWSRARSSTGTDRPQPARTARHGPPRPSRPVTAGGGACRRPRRPAAQDRARTGHRRTA